MLQQSHNGTKERAWLIVAFLYSIVPITLQYLNHGPLIMPQWAEPQRHMVVTVCLSVCLSHAFLCNDYNQCIKNCNASVM